MHITVRPHSETSAFAMAFARERDALNALTPSQRTWMTDDHKPGYAMHCVITPEDGIADVVRQVVATWTALQRMVAATEAHLPSAGTLARAESADNRLPCNPSEAA